MTTFTRPLTLMGLLISLRAGRVRLELDAEGLRVEAPAGVLTETMREAIRQHRAALESLPRPFLNKQDELIVPILAPPQYHWQPIVQTLTELHAPPNVWRAQGWEKLGTEDKLVTKEEAERRNGD